MKKLTVLMASFLLLAACSNDQAAQTETEEPKKEEVAAEQKEMTEEGFITQVTESQILVNNIYFTINDKVAVQSDNGTETSDSKISDIRTGMKVSVDYQGPLAEKFPMEGEAETLTILTDEESTKRSEALQVFINKEQLSSLLMMGQPIVRDNEIGFLFSNMETGDVSEVRIDLDTHEYTIGGK
ncbi:DUF3221 domain-containing protein [Planomicrobium sp. CPCC 101079]|uniref:DUF3221 domain-containing protein n=1 Tax=Planomicrobium sp. CPCC 101079 TaxID=2599618 RepID=UPI0011B822E2|nr:DUF3221 domain-containing protein [Planomicrobium sp. CPCC 101079]TWT09185.1 hypothetical protein FQV28_06000 [Planomicrobium sp. CPCC 101079]